jgi:hypothetical protein
MAKTLKKTLPQKTTGVKSPLKNKAKNPHPWGTGKKPRQDFVPHEILAWADYIAGVPQVETAKKLKLSRDTIHDAREKVAAFIAKQFDINAYRLPLYSLYPEWVASVLALLRKHDVTMTVALGRGLQLLVDKQVNESEDTSNLSNDELVERIQRRLEAARK